MNDKPKLPVLLKVGPTIALIVLALLLLPIILGGFMRYCRWIIDLLG